MGDRPSPSGVQGRGSEDKVPKKLNLFVNQHENSDVAESRNLQDNMNILISLACAVLLNKTRGR